uniref:Uncharacterized protein n=1 Tax=Fundulus heteroclitus TaxID=8078 RepID=A0A3Q2TM29_FUNHE
MNCGYTGIILLDKKEEMMRYVYCPMFLFVQYVADADFIISVCQAEFSEKGSNKEQSEVDLMNHFQDFLQELEQGSGESSLSSENGSSLSPSAFLQWITGQAHIPVLQEERKNFQVNVQFLHQFQHMQSYDDFKCVLLEAFHMGQEFTRV